MANNQQINNQYQPYLVALNLTQRCNLKCAHCYLDAGGKTDSAKDELSTSELKALFSEISERAEGTLIVLTGGEPLLRPDIVELTAAGNALGLRMVLGTNGMLLTSKVAQELKGAGLQGVGISLDNLHPEGHDRFRGVSGAWEKTLTAIRACRACGLHVQLHTTVTHQNANQIEAFVEFAKKEGASILNFFFLVCTGRGQWMNDISPEQYEDVLERIAELQRETKSLMIQARCAPHFKRILYQHDSQSAFTRAQGYDGGGCPAATHYCRIDPQGNVTPCPYMENVAGNIRQSGFWNIWNESSLFQRFRSPSLNGRCGSCEFRNLCGGCRARAQERFEDIMAEDPTCTWQPKTNLPVAIDLPSGKLDGSVEWSAEAEKRLKRIPIFLRGMIRKRLEEKVRLMNTDFSEKIVITPEFMAEHRKQREQELGIKFEDANPTRRTI
ncbi:MAG: radical SAM protein [SAR324 cluster bacterium]|nr:radical SAM protein [SAR324 cluster bacterium]